MYDVTCLLTMRDLTVLSGPQAARQADSYIYIYIYICVCVCVSVCSINKKKMGMK